MAYPKSEMILKNSLAKVVCSNNQAIQLQVTSTFKAVVSGVYAAGQFIVRSRYMEVRAYIGYPY